MSQLLILITAAALAGTLFLVAIIELGLTVQRRKHKERINQRLHEIHIQHQQHHQSQTAAAKSTTDQEELKKLVIEVTEKILPEKLSYNVQKDLVEAALESLTPANDKK